eukprot:snap_masked-scaffold_3-processed-gene-4.11-mRNA-1 protein AED:1.00 eAED:1.00 QI:0/0/0/0/1/1/2/0/240
MLDCCAEAGIVSFFHMPNLPEDENYIFFAPSFLAQALGKKYIDTGKINKNLFNFLLKEYTDTERKYILQTTLKHFILFRAEKDRDIFIVPELLPLVDERLRPTSRSNILLVHNFHWTITDFVRIFNWLLKPLDNKEVNKTLLCKGFARFIFTTTCIVDIYLKSNKELSLKLVQGSNYVWFKSFVTKIQDEQNPKWVKTVLLSEDEKFGVTLKNARKGLWRDYFSRGIVEENLFERFFGMV